MGQYFRIVNMTKREVISPYKLGCGAKLWEICASNLGNLLPFLLRKSQEIKAGGDVQQNFKFAGHWVNDQIMVIGDYDESGIFDISSTFTDISHAVVKEYNKFIGDKNYKIIISKGV